MGHDPSAADRGLKPGDVIAANVHGVKNRLWSIGGSLSELSRQCAPELAEAIQREVAALDGVSRDMSGLMTWYRVSRRHCDMKVPVRIGDLLDDASIDDARSGIAIETVLDASCVPDSMVVVDRALLLEGLRNLVGNAVRHARTRISICVRRTEEGVAFVIEDDGPGFPENTATPLPSFDPTRTGVGLLLVRKIARKHEYRGHRGSMEIGHSQSLGGASVTVNLPCALKTFDF